MKVECENCHKKFNRKPSEIGCNTFCSKKCFHIALAEYKTLNGNYRGGLFVKCVICGTSHYRTPSGIKCGNNHPCCSMKCLGEWKSLNLVGEKASNFKGKLKRIICKICKLEFTTYQKKQKYCSQKCRAIGILKQETRTCQNCNKKFSRPRSSFIWHQKRGHTKLFCSIKCRTEHFNGLNCTNWIKDRSKLKNRKKSFRASIAMKAWRISIFERDNFTCKICGDKSCKGNKVTINAHHIIPIKQNESLALDTDNGITLCEQCHKKTYQKEAELSKVFFEIINRGVHDGKIKLSAPALAAKEG